MTGNVTLSGTVATVNGSRYLQQLCKHWSHRFEVSFDRAQGKVKLPLGELRLTAMPDGLQIELTGAKEEDIPRAKEVVASHLDRFAFREAPLDFVWR